MSEGEVVGLVTGAIMWSLLCFVVGFKEGIRLARTRMAKLR